MKGVLQPCDPMVIGIDALGQRNVGYVNPEIGSDMTGQIGTLKPYKTIQAFIDDVPPGNDAGTARNVFTAIISPADYDEDLAIDLTRRRIVLTGPGSWNLGSFGAVDWSPSGVRRNITVTVNDTNVSGIRPGLAIGSFLPISEAMTTHESYLTKPRISGLLDLTAAGAAGSVELALTCEIFGMDSGPPLLRRSIDAGATIIQSYMYHSRMRERLFGTNWQFQVAQRCRFDELVEVANYSLLQSCRFDDGMTVTAVPPAGIVPFGMLLTNFSGTFTGPPASLLLDGNSNFHFKANGALLAGGATKVIQDDLVP